MKNKNWICIALLLLVMTTSAFAQNQWKGNATKPELRKELRQYAKQNVRPFLITKRLELNKKLSKADKRELEDILQQLSQLRQTQSEQVQKMKSERRAQRKALTEEEKTAFKELRNQKRQQMERLAALAKRNEKQLTFIKNQVKPQQEKWAADIKAIILKHGVSPEILERRLQKRKQMQGHLQRWNTARFLLMDPNQPDRFSRHPKRNNEAVTASSLQISPNPVSATATLSFEIKKESVVRIQLMDQQGQVVQTLPEQKYPAGKQELVIQVPDVKPGVYFYRLTTASGSETVRLLKQ